MPSPLPELKKIQELIEIAQMGPAASLADETHQSYPIPLSPTCPLQVAFLFCPSRLQRRVGLQLLPPMHRAVLDAATGKVLEMRKVTPSELGVPDDPGTVLGVFGLPKGMSSEEFLKEQGQLRDAYDVLLPYYAAGMGLGEAGSRAQKAASEFLRLFPRVTEPPLAPYYRALGEKFFRWLQN